MSLHPDYIVHLAMERNARAGQHYFDDDTLRGFGSKAHEGFAMEDGSTLVVMSNKDRNGWVVGGARHYYVVSIGADGIASNKAGSGYSVTNNEGFWMTLRSATKWAAARQREAEVVALGCKEEAKS